MSYYCSVWNKKNNKMNTKIIIISEESRKRKWNDFRSNLHSNGAVIFSYETHFGLFHKLKALCDCITFAVAEWLFTDSLGLRPKLCEKCFKQHLCSISFVHSLSFSFPCFVLFWALICMSYISMLKNLWANVTYLQNLFIFLDVRVQVCVFGWRSFNKAHMLQFFFFSLPKKKTFRLAVHLFVSILITSSDEKQKISYLFCSYILRL